MVGIHGSLPEVRSGALEESSSFAWLAAAALNACDPCACVYTRAGDRDVDRYCMECVTTGPGHNTPGRGRANT